MTTTEALYTAVVEVVGGRGGHASSRTGTLELDLARPAERGTGAGTDPEELFAAGYAACFDSSLTAAARRAKVRLGPVTVTASVSLHAADEGRFGISAALVVDAPECGQEQLAALVATAHDVCPYSNALRAGAPVTIEVRGTS